MNWKQRLLLATIVIFIPHASAQEQAVLDVLDKVSAAYAALDTYRSEGTITAVIEMGGTKTATATSFSILLQKPNRYKIVWEQKMDLGGMPPQSGAVWSDGTQPYLYMGALNAYSKINGDEMALGGATGISGGAANTIPSLFLSVNSAPNDPFARLIDPQFEPDEEVRGEDCYVIGGASVISKKETFWISKTGHLVRKYHRSLEPPEEGIDVPEMTEAQLEEAIKAMGQEVTEASKKQMREMMSATRVMFNNMDMKGSTTELHAEIAAPELSDGDFTYEPPDGTKLKESLFGDLLGGSSE